MKAEDLDIEDHTEFTLLKEQEPHFERALNRIREYGFYADNSVMGCGKTYVAVSVAKELGLPLFVVCPLTVQSNWRTVARIAGVEVVATITPQSLASKVGKQPKHGYLTRNDRCSPPIFLPTSKLTDLVSRGAFFVYDEIQFARNINTWFLACKTINEVIGLNGGKLIHPSRTAFVSTTPFDMKEKCSNFLILVNLFKDTSIKSKKSIITERAARDLRDFCVHHSIPLTSLPAGLDEVYEFFLEAIQPRLFSSMPLILEKHCDIRNGFYTVSNSEEEQHLKDAIDDLNSVFVKMDPETHKISLDTIKKMTKARWKIEKAKIPLFARLIRRYLRGNNKVIVCLHFNHAIEELSRIFATANPLVLTGKVKADERKHVISSFQKPSTHRRLLITNIRVGGVGISLHDLDGRYPRTMLISPDYNVTDIFQATGRVNRVGSKSDSTVRIVYANVSVCERSILHAISNKMSTIKQTLGDDVRDVLKLPTDFEDYIEGKQRFPSSSVKNKEPEKPKKKTQ